VGLAPDLARRVLRGVGGIRALARGRRDDARALATFIPDCVVLVTRLARDPRAGALACCCSCVGVFSEEALRAEDKDEDQDREDDVER
jgi:hypothetical protein